MKIKPCKMCGKEFMPQQRAQKYCCKECSKAADKAARKRVWEKVKEENRRYIREQSKPDKSIAEVDRLAQKEGLSYGIYSAKMYS